MNDLQNSKLQLAQEELSALQATLKIKERELQQMKRLTRGDPDQLQVTTYYLHALSIMSDHQMVCHHFSQQTQQDSQGKVCEDHGVFDTSDISTGNKSGVGSCYLGADASSDVPEPVTFEGSQVSYENEHSGGTFPDTLLAQKTLSVSVSQDSEREQLSAGTSSLKHSPQKSMPHTPEQFQGSLSDTSLDSISSHGSLRIRRGRLTGG